MFACAVPPCLLNGGGVVMFAGEAFVFLVLGAVFAYVAFNQLRSG